MDYGFPLVAGLLTMLLAILVACIDPAAPSLDDEGYERISVPSGCYKHGAERHRNVQLSSHLQKNLIGLARADENARRCWYERRDSKLILAIGDECAPHRTTLFQRTQGVWKVVEVRNVSMVNCEGAKG